APGITQSFGFCDICCSDEADCAPATAEKKVSSAALSNATEKRRTGNAFIVEPPCRAERSGRAAWCQPPLNHPWSADRVPVPGSLHTHEFNGLQWPRSDTATSCANTAPDLQHICTACVTPARYEHATRRGRTRANAPRTRRERQRPRTRMGAY